MTDWPWPLPQLVYSDLGPLAYPPSLRKEGLILTRSFGGCSLILMVEFERQIWWFDAKALSRDLP